MSTHPLASSIEAILFDMNGTLRARETHPPTQLAARRRILDLLELHEDPPGFWDDLSQRYKAYGTWAQEAMRQLPEKEIWTRWLLPDLPPGRIEPVAELLTLAWSQRNGRCLPKPGAEETLLTLRQRGFRLGVISNSPSSLDIPLSLEEFGWKPLFEVVVLSLAVERRKPAPEIFWKATSQMQISPSRCAYVGNRKSRDVLGCKRAGFAMGIILEIPGKPRADEMDPTIQADVTIHALEELLEIFPGRESQIPIDGNVHDHSSRA